MQELLFIAGGGLIVFAIVYQGVIEYRRYRWIKRNRRGGFVHPTGKRRL